MARYSLGCRGGVGPFADVPAAGGVQLVVGSAAEGFGGDVTAAAVAPVLNVHDVVQMRRDRAAGKGGAAVVGVQHDPLLHRCQPPGAGQVQRDVRGPLEEA